MFWTLIPEVGSSVVTSVRTKGASEMIEWHSNY